MTKKEQKKRIKAEKYETEEQIEINRFLRILVILIILVLGVYFFTRAFITKDLFENDEETNVTSGEIDYNTTLVGNMFNKKESEYYVIVYDIEEISSIYYSGLVNNYLQNSDAKKVYLVDLNNPLNEKYVAKEGEKAKPNTMNFEELKFGDITLIKMKNGKIEKALTTDEEIEKELVYKSTES